MTAIETILGAPQFSQRDLIVERFAAQWDRIAVRARQGFADDASGGGLTDDQIGSVIAANESMVEEAREEALRQLGQWLDREGIA